MARNEEKQFGRLNRLILAKEKEEQLKKNPPRPKLCTLKTAAEIRRWLPSIKKDIDFNLKQSQVPCYPESKINEHQNEVDRLSKLYKAFVQKIKDLDPNFEVVPWTERAYSGKKRHADEAELHVGTSEAEEDNSDTVRTEELKRNSEAKIEESTFAKLQRIETPILNKPRNMCVKIPEESDRIIINNVNTELQDKPLSFTVCAKRNLTVKEALKEAKKRQNLSNETHLFQKQTQSPNLSTENSSLVSTENSSKTTNPLGVEYSSSDEDS